MYLCTGTVGTGFFQNRTDEIPVRLGILTFDDQLIAVLSVDLPIDTRHRFQHPDGIGKALPLNLYPQNLRGFLRRLLR